MKIVLLIFTLIFSFSVLADCCTYEITTAEAVEEDHDDCGSEEKHSEKDHCECPLSNHSKILSNKEISVSAPFSTPVPSVSDGPEILLSSFEASIFHPPIF